MKLNNAVLLRLLPAFMRSDAANQGLAAACDPMIHDLAARAEKDKTWNQLGSMSSKELDDLAWELNIEWYYPNADIETKRRIIRESDLVHARLGTKWAVEEVISAYFGNGRVEEWFEYGGEPYCFRVFSDNLLSTKEDAQRFVAALNIVKNVRSRLDAILINRTWSDVLSRDYFTWAGVLGPTGAENTWDIIAGQLWEGEN